MLPYFHLRELTVIILINNLYAYKKKNKDDFCGSDFMDWSFQMLCDIWQQIKMYVFFCLEWQLWPLL